MRVDRAATITTPSSLDDVASAIADYVAAGNTTVYVERRASRYRWSPAHRGGAYPLLRIVARYLECAHTEIVLPFVTVDGYAVVADPDEPRISPFAFLDASSLDASDLASAIAQALPEAAPTGQ